MMQHLIGREVVVHTSETIYRCKLIELGSSELFLQAEDGWIVVPVDKIDEIKEAE